MRKYLPRRTRNRQIVPVALGVAVGALLVTAWTNTLPLALRLSPKYEGSTNLTSLLDCAADQCVAVNLGFSGPSSLNPWSLGLEVEPVNHSMVVNGSAGGTLNLSYLGGVPGWLGHLRNGTYSYPPCAIVVDPDGHSVSTGSDEVIEPGALLFFEGYPGDASSAEEFVLTIIYGSTSASLSIQVA